MRSLIASIMLHSDCTPKVTWASSGLSRTASMVWRSASVSTPLIINLAQEPEERILSVFDVLHEVISEPGFRGCAFANAAAEYPHHAGVQEAIAYDRTWLPALFSRLLGPLPADNDDELVAALVQVHDGATAAAHIDHAKTSADRPENRRAPSGRPKAGPDRGRGCRQSGRRMRL